MPIQPLGGLSYRFHLNIMIRKFKPGCNTLTLNKSSDWTRCHHHNRIVDIIMLHSQPGNENNLSRMIDNLFCGIFFLLLLFLAGCQPKVYLMPPPIAIGPGTDYFDLIDDNKDDNRLNTLYATNRVPNNVSAMYDKYTIFPSDDLRLGVVTHIVGEEGTTWDDFFNNSLNREREEKLLITLEDVEEFITISDEQGVDKSSPENKDFFDRINKVLYRSFDKDITVYVHGANSNFYRATAQGAQYFHYTGHNSLVLNFSWPSAENIFKYKVDVLHAGKTVPAFARLLEVLAFQTNAKNINIISYSAGAQVVAPALRYLRESHPDTDAVYLKQRYRIGEVYFAAPDIEFSSFVARFNGFKDIVGRITASVNMNDSVLRYAKLRTGGPRLGRPSLEKITEEEKDILIAASRGGKFDILDIQGSPSLKAGRSHSFWYSHPWVSNDLLFLMHLNMRPEKRGLKRFQHETGLVIWHFPEDYEDKVQRIVDQLQSQVQL